MTGHRKTAIYIYNVDSTKHAAKAASIYYYKTRQSKFKILTYKSGIGQKNTKSAGIGITAKCQSLLNGTGSKANLSNYLTSHPLEMRESVQPLGRVLGVPSWKNPCGIVGAEVGKWGRGESI